MRRPDRTGSGRIGSAAGGRPAGMARRKFQHTRNLRCMHDAPQDVLVESYPEEEFWQERRVTDGNTNEARWRGWSFAPLRNAARLAQHGVNQPPLSGALHVARTNAFFMAAGKRSSMPITVAPNGWAYRFAITRRFTR